MTWQERRNKRFSSAVLAAALFVPLVPARAFAQSDAARTDAYARFNEGLALHDAGNDEQARVKFSQAYAVLQTPNILFNLARSEQLSGHLLEASQHFRRFVRDPRAPADLVPKAKANIDDLAKALGHVAVDAPKGARILIDDQPSFEEPPFAEPLDVEAGHHVIVARFGKRESRCEVDVAAGASATATGLDFGGGPLVEPPGTETKKLAFPPPTPSLILGGVAVVGLGLGVGFATASQSKKSDLDSTTGPGCGGVPGPDCQTRSDLKSSADTSATIATVSYVVSGVALAGALVTWFVWPRKAAVPVTGLSLTPSVGPKNGGLRLQASF